MNSAFFVAALVAHNIEIAAKNDILARKKITPNLLACASSTNRACSWSGRIHSYSRPYAPNFRLTILIAPDKMGRSQRILISGEGSQCSSDALKPDLFIAEVVRQCWFPATSNRKTSRELIDRGGRYGSRTFDVYPDPRILSST
jgi:hypothetical protein